MSYKIQETYVNRTKGYMYEQTEIVETHTETLGELFKKCQKEFGRCESKMFVDTANPHDPMQVGWVFVRDCLYDDGHARNKEDWYTREVWVLVFGDNGDKLFLK